MLTIIISCLISAGLFYEPTAQWRLTKIEWKKPSSILYLCTTTPCEQSKDDPRPYFVLEGTVKVHEKVDVPQFCTLVSLALKEP